MKKKSNKLVKLEKSRYSIVTKRKCCVVCNNPIVDINEIFMGRNRINSMKYGLTIPLCRIHHEKYHIDRSMQLYWMRKGEQAFLDEYNKTIYDFIDIFKNNYL